MTEEEPTWARPDQDPAATPEPEPPASPVAVAAELRELTAKYQRLAADFENFRRRKAQEAQEQVRYGAAGLLSALLPALDNLHRAVAHLPEEQLDGMAEGLRLTVRQLEETLASQGVHRIPTLGEPFNPRLHEAVATVEGGDVDPDTVVDELRSGYMLYDRVIRPAQVSVARPAIADAGSDDETQAAEPERPN